MSEIPQTPHRVGGNGCFLKGGLHCFKGLRSFFFSRGVLPPGVPFPFWVFSRRGEFLSLWWSSPPFPPFSHRFLFLISERSPLCEMDLNCSPLRSGLSPSPLVSPPRGKGGPSRGPGRSSSWLCAPFNPLEHAIAFNRWLSSFFFPPVLDSLCTVVGHLSRKPPSIRCVFPSRQAFFS